MEQFSLVALLTPLFSLLMIFRAFSLYWKQQQTWRELLLWIVLWVGIGFVAFRPEVLNVLPPWLGIKSGVNVLIFFGFVVLFYGFFRLFTKVEELEHKIVEMNRAKSILDFEEREEREEREDREEREEREDREEREER